MGNTAENGSGWILIHTRERVWGRVNLFAHLATEALKGLYNTTATD
jgi:hypothetical protein